MVQYGFSPLQFGAMMITGLAIGLITPPVGMCLNACNKINRMPIIEIFKGAAPYVICNVIVLISISLWGPRLPPPCRSCCGRPCTPTVCRTPAQN